MRIRSSADFTINTLGSSFRKRQVTLIAFACSRALAFYRPSIGWSKLGLAVGGRSGDAVWLRRLLRRSEPLGAQPSFHLHYDAPRSEQTRSRPSTASIEAPLHSASATQIGPLETTSQRKGLAFASPMGVRTRHISNNSSHKRFQTLYREYRSHWPLVTSPTDAMPTNRNGTCAFPIWSPTAPTLRAQPENIVDVLRQTISHSW